MMRWAKAVFFILFAVAIVLYAAGVFGGDRVAPGKAAAPPGLEAPAATARAERALVPAVEEAVGTVRSRRRVELSAQVVARIVEVAADAGDTVRRGAPLVKLDDRELGARADQARQALAAAEAARDRALQAKARGDALLAQAKARFERVQALHKGGAATEQQIEDAEASFLEAEAGVAEAVAAIAAAEAQIEGAKNVVTAAEVALGHAVIAAPLDGVVTERLVEVGDLALPGRPLLVLLDPKALRFEADIREGLVARVREGMKLEVEIPAAAATVEGTVSEIIPAADPRSRTFRARIDLPAAEGAYPGMFGRLRLPVGEREIVRIPAVALVRVGQLETVVVRDGGLWARRYVTTGRALPGGAVEVLSGLQGGEEIGLAGSGS
jgi:multidrug efflux pump subunit AcrA (membrane-fusion protein)